MKTCLMGVLGLSCVMLVGACGSNECQSCEDCPDFTGVYYILQTPLNEMCMAYELVEGTIPYEISRQEGNSLEIIHPGYEEPVYVGKICGSGDAATPRAFPFEVHWMDLLEEGESVSLTLSGKLIEATAQSPARMDAVVNLSISHPTDTRFNCSMMGTSVGDRVD